MLTGFMSMAVLGSLGQTGGEPVQGAGFLDWEAPWCIYRIAIWAGLSFVAWLICRTQFGRRLRNHPDIYPSQAVGECLGLCWLVSALLFAAVFSFLGPELVLKNQTSASRLFPANWRWMNVNWPWLLAILIGIGGYLVFLATHRRGKTSD